MAVNGNTILYGKYFKATMFNTAAITYNIPPMYKFKFKNTLLNTFLKSK